MTDNGRPGKRDRNRVRLLQLRHGEPRDARRQALASGVWRGQPGRDPLRAVQRRDLLGLEQGGDPLTEGPGSRPPLRGIPPTGPELYLLTWGQETLKENLKLTNDILRQQVTLSAALIAATIALRGAAILTTAAAGITLAILILSLLSAWLGAMPYEGQV